MRACGLAVHGAKANPLTGVAPVLIGRAQRAQRSGTSAALRYRVGWASATVAAAASMTSATAGSMPPAAGTMAASAGPMAAAVAGAVGRRPVNVPVNMHVPVDMHVPV